MKKRTMKTSKLIAELREFGILSLYLFLCFFSFSFYRCVVLDHEAMEAVHYGYAFFESVILAKIILIGKWLQLGNRFQDKPLYVPVLYKTAVFCVFVTLFGIVEHFSLGLLSGANFRDLYDAFIAKSCLEIVGRIPLFFAIFTPFFCFIELGRVLGDGVLFRLFFQEGSKHS